MNRKIISFCTAVVVAASCIQAVSAATLKDVITSLPSYEQNFKQVDIDVNSDLELQQSGTGAYTDGPLTVQVSRQDPSASVDYKATLYMQSVRDEFTRYWNTAKLLCDGDSELLAELDEVPVTGEFTIGIQYPATMSIPNSILETGNMVGFNDEAKLIFKDTERNVITSENKLEIKIKVKNPTDDTKEYVTGKELADNLDTYLADLTFTCEGVLVKGAGMHRVTGTVTGSTKIGDYEILTGTEEDPISTITYTAVQIQSEDHPSDMGKTSIYEDVALVTPSPTAPPHIGGGGGTSSGSSGGGLIAGGDTGGNVSTPIPQSTITPSEPETTAELNREDHYAYIIGYPEGDVRPENDITRAEVATIFYRMLTDESRASLWTEENNYSDVNVGDWYNNAISTMSAAGVLNGYEDGTFKPNAAITRAEFAAIIARFIGGTYSGLDKFSDISGHWAREYINRASQYGWINGYEDGTYRPNQNITRAEAMTLVNNVLDRHVTETGMTDDMVTWTDNTPDDWYYTAVQEATNSHEYERADGVAEETWTSITETPDWSAIDTDPVINTETPDITEGTEVEGPAETTDGTVAEEPTETTDGTEAEEPTETTDGTEAEEPTETTDTTETTEETVDTTDTTNTTEAE